ncbi:MAG: thiamine diphosphokinase [Candidatus Cloacimonetes bacterium]|nr:thiamine diphosphokinase [Candidatus Cloacimonadota bacterium]
MKKRSVVILLNGEQVEARIFERLRDKSALIIAVDGGLHNCRELQVSPDYLLGDLDSADSVSEIQVSTKIIRSTDQDTTDLDKALAFALSLAPVRIQFFAAFGLRSDHTFGNMISLMNFCARNTIPVEIVDNKGITRFLRPGIHHIRLPKNQTVSFFSFGPILDLSLQGFVYALSSQNYPENFCGISNICNAEKCIIKFRSGILCMYLLHQTQL